MNLTTEKLGGIEQYSGTLKFSKDELIDRVDLYLVSAPQHLYHGDIVNSDKRCTDRPNGYYTTDGFPFCEIIANRVIEKGLNVCVDNDCKYSLGDRASIRIPKKDKVTPLKGNMSQMKEYYMGAGVRRQEDRMSHCLYVEEGIDGYSVIDYQTPTSDNGHDKIDLILRKDEIVYITEVKRFSSDESFLRCALEITTYRKKLNSKFFELFKCTEKTLKKAVLIDEKSFAFSQLELPWAKDFLEDITVFKLSKDDKVFHIREY